MKYDCWFECVRGCGQGGVPEKHSIFDEVIGAASACCQRSVNEAS